jgi:hypothetical protein
MSVIGHQRVNQASQIAEEQMAMANAMAERKKNKKQTKQTNKQTNK